MAILDDLADELARETLELAEATGDAELVRKVSENLAASSTVTQEAFMAAIRVRQAVSRARKLLKDTARAAKVAQAAKEKPGE